MKIKATEFDYRKATGQDLYKILERETISDQLSGIGSVAIIAEDGTFPYPVGGDQINEIDFLAQQMANDVDFDMRRDMDEAEFAEYLSLTIKRWRSNLLRGYDGYGDKLTNSAIIAVAQLIFSYKDGIDRYGADNYEKIIVNSAGYRDAVRKVVQLREKRPYGVKEFDVHGPYSGKCVVFYPDGEEISAIKLAEMASGERRLFDVVQSHKGAWLFSIGRIADRNGIARAIADASGVRLTDEEVAKSIEVVLLEDKEKTGEESQN